MKLSKLAVGIAAVLAFSGQAMAGVTINLGDFTGTTKSLAISDTVTAGSFTDNWLFTVGSSSFSSAVTSATLGSLFNIDGLTATLIKATTYGGTTGTTIVTASAHDLLGFGSASLIAPVSLSAGYYDLKITGNATGSFGGTYGGGLNVSPVPEAETYSMMLMGLGLMGFIARRRRNDEA